uniref:WGS project CAEQ00000000 data, annotated contig 560 n=1 Tax=Trypanosoma congolense (strain IL3000) TaxID=1068625 RepID=F9WGW1_TRYCI|nr:unnamed protein product [Trypanosoma congolense IL3000]
MDRNLLSGGSGGYIRDGVTGSRGKTEVESAEIYGNNQRGVAVCAEAFKEQLRMGLRSINEEEYYLVRYRDYSAWAVQHYACVAKRDSYLWKKYVEQCFAVHVGKEPGELIPITEAQFLFGVELLQRQLLEYVGMCDSLDINYCALSKDQFRSLGVILGDGMRPVGVEGEELQRRREEEAEAARRSTNPHADAYVPPSMWDWTPGAIKKRIRHQLQLQYSRIGRFVVRVVMFGAVTYIVWSYVQPLLPQGDGTGGGNRRQRRGRGPRGQYDAYEGDGASFVPRSLFRSVLLGPKEVFDYILGPPA